MADPTNAELDERLKKLEEKSEEPGSSGYPKPPPGTTLTPMFPGWASTLLTGLGFILGLFAAWLYIAQLWPADTMKGGEEVEGVWTAADLTSAATFALGALLLLTGVGLLSGEVMKLVKEPANPPKMEADAAASTLKDVIEAVASLAGKLTPARLLIAIGVVLLLANAYVAKG